ncbi:MAG: spermidine synthase [Paracoccaceae bacterium]|jgi:spermidine synthase
MLPWEPLATAVAPGGGALRLLRRGVEYSIRLDAGELMNSRLSGSEEALATLAMAKIAGRAKARVLVGGLGMGFTLRALQDCADGDAALTVAELVPELVDWARGPMAPLFGDSLADPRLSIRVGDVGAIIREAPGAWDAILLDVDNGPEAMTRPANDSLYGETGLAEAKRALSPGGVLTVWSAVGDPAFTKRLRQLGFDTEAVQVRAGRTGKGARHTIWVARKGR